MIRTNVIKGKMVENGYSAQMMAKELGITPQTFYSKMRKGIFDSDEMFKMISLLNITDPAKIFFANEVSNEDANNFNKEDT